MGYLSLTITLYLLFFNYSRDNTNFYANEYYFFIFKDAKLTIKIHV
jgi:hypothetical protein